MNAIDHADIVEPNSVGDWIFRLDTVRECEESFRARGLRFLALRRRLLRGPTAALVQHPSIDLSDLYQLADATQRLYLKLPSLYDYGAALTTERQRLLWLIKRRAAPQCKGN